MSTQQRLRTHNLGYPRIGQRRELKWATEAFWNKKIDADALQAVARSLRADGWRQQQAAGIDLIPANDASFYDHVLDTICLVGAIPKRFGWDGGPLDLNGYFRLARGAAGTAAHGGIAPLEMTKWFDTNYHYLVPELEWDMHFALSATKVFDEFAEAAALGIHTMPVLLGPVTFLLLSTSAKDAAPFDPIDLLDTLLPVYEDIVCRLTADGATWVQFDEPAFALDLGPRERSALQEAYTRLVQAAPTLKFLVATYFGDLRDNLSTLVQLPVHAVHVDGVRGAAELPAIAEALHDDKLLSVGIIDGRNIWKTDLDSALSSLEGVARRISHQRLLVAPSCSLLHVPLTLDGEDHLDPEIRSWLAFADEKLAEVRILADALDGTPDEVFLADSRRVHVLRQSSSHVHNPLVAERLATLDRTMYQRALPFTERQQLQRARLHLPLVPTTTIGSFPQTNEVRSIRARWRRGSLETAEYERFLEHEVDALIAKQEELGLDLLVHGELERNDMVEYFGEQLDGYAHTENGWVQSYGTRCVKPPIVFGDIARRQAMTVRWSSYAQSRTKQPVKGMLTGPVTMLKWSFVRDDLPLSETATQIALAIRDEVNDLEQAGIVAIQIDEPALREGLPLRHAERQAYLQWAVDAFRLSAAGAAPETQIHSHMCYAEFDDILDAIAALDVDVISIEAARSGMDVLQSLVAFRYPNEIGPGIYDIHTPRVPDVAEMANLLRRIASVLPPNMLWANPDCGLKTRRWEEVLPALRNLVAAAAQVREAVQHG